MAVSENPNSNQNNQANRNAENINREIRQEPRQTETINNNNERTRNNNNALIACSLLAGASLARNNNMVYINQQETQTRNFSVDFIPSAIQIFDISTNIVSSGNQVVFDTNDINTGISYTYGGGNTVDIISSGIYQITFVSNISGTVDGQTANFVIAVNGVPVASSQIVQSVDNAQTYNVKTQLLIKVTETPTTISIINNGIDAIQVFDASLMITKISN